MDEQIRLRLLKIMFISIGALILTGGFLFVINKDATTPLDPTVQTQKALTVYFFYGEECPYCHDTMPFIQELTRKRPDVDFQVLEIWHNATNKNLANKMLVDLGQQYKGVPLVIVGNITLVGSKEIPDRLEGIIINKTGRNNG